MPRYMAEQSPPNFHVVYTAWSHASPMRSLRDLLVGRGCAILHDKIGKSGRELIVRSAEGRMAILCAASDNPYHDISVLEEVFYGEGELSAIGPRISLSPPPKAWLGD